MLQNYKKRNGRLHFWYTHRTANIVIISHLTIFLENYNFVACLVTSDTSLKLGRGHNLWELYTCWHIVYTQLLWGYTLSYVESRRRVLAGAFWSQTNIGFYVAIL